MSLASTLLEFTDSSGSFAFTTQEEKLVTTPRSQASDQRETSHKTDFGAFYPTDHIVVAFKEYDDAEQVCDELRADGYKEEECDLHTAEEVAEATQRNLDNTGLMARLGKSTAAIEEHQKAAQNGATFLLVHAPHERDTQRVMQAVCKRSFILAHRYGKLTIEDLSGHATIQTTSAR
jgi:hypothetical protein